jgi:hypothetical protein
MTRRVVRYCFGVLLLSLLLGFCFTGVQSSAQDLSACEQVVTNEHQLARIFDCDTFCLPIDPPEFKAWLIWPQFLWADFGCLPKEFSAALAESKQQVDGVTVIKLRLTRAILTGETLVELPGQAGSVKLEAPAGYEPTKQDWATRNALNTWQQYVEWGELDKSLAPTLWLEIALADVNEKVAYEEAQRLAEESLMLSQSMFAESSSMAFFSEESEGGGVATATYQVNFCQGIPVTAISKTTNGNIRLEWVGDTNDTYAVQYADKMEWFNTWHLAGDNLTNLPTNASWEDVGILNSNVTARFYRVVRKDANYGLPCVTILSPTNGATLSGLVDIGVYATDDSRIYSLTLMVDGNDLITIRDGPMRFRLPTALFPNGAHTLTVRAVDNAGLPGLGGDPNSQSLENAVVSLPVDVTFTNDITVDWFPLFRTQLPIGARLAFQTADWIVEVKSTNGLVLKTLSGATTNGSISTVWDGTDGGGASVPAKSVYQISLSATPQGGSGANLASTGTTVDIYSFKEESFQTAQTLLTREKWLLPDTELISTAKLRSISQWIELAEENADVYLGAPLVLQNAAGWQELKGYLTDPAPRDITQLYFYGHGGGNTLGFGLFTFWQGRGFEVQDIEDALGNHIGEGPLGLYPEFHTPYKFVFLDGCNTAGGNWPQAFGILKDQRDYSTTVGAKNRAFMGWNFYIWREFIFNPNMPQFTVSFWQHWTEDIERPLSTAISMAYDDVPILLFPFLRVYGYNQLTWGD